VNAADYRFCPICGRTPLVSERGGRAKRCQACHRTFHSAPRAAVDALIVDAERRVLLTRRAVDPAKNQWDAPGGFVDVGESLEEGLRREVREALGVDISIHELSGTYADVYGDDATPIIAIYYLATIAGGTPSAGHEVSELRWFPPDDLPILAFENCRLALQAWGARGGPEGADGPAPAGARPTILLVEDDDPVRALMVEVLEAEDYTVLAASDPGRAFEWAERHRGAIDVLVTDVILPGMNGREAAARLRAMHPGIRVLLTSGYPDQRTDDLGGSRAGTGFLAKPFSPETLRGKMREVLAARP
jgi:ADP-ribose pyrophosphatase YjhB (NUDIX family)/CheY-like chemotaxis protein